MDFSVLIESRLSFLQFILYKQLLTLFDENERPFYTVIIYSNNRPRGR